MLAVSIFFNVALCFVVWRLKGSKSTKDTIKAVIQGGGGPDPTKPN